MTVQQDIEQQLQDRFSPVVLEVANESHMHSVPANSETHFRVVLVSANFDGRTRVARHQQVYAALADQLPTYLQVGMSGVPVRVTAAGGVLTRIDEVFFP